MQFPAILKRAPVPFSVTIVLIVMVTSYWIGDRTWKSVWNSVGVQIAKTYSFEDARVVARAIDCKREGINPYDGECKAPHKQVFSYPSAWFWFDFIGFHEKNTELIGILFIILVLLSLLILIEVNSHLTLIIAVSTIASPSILLGFERGNVDLLLFSALVLIFFASSFLPRRIMWVVEGLLIVFLTVLKIYPVGGAVALVKSRASIFKSLVVGAFAAFAFWYSIPSADIPFIINNAPQDSIFSFGSLPLFLGLKRIFGLGEYTFSVRALASALATLVCLLVFAYVYILRPNLRAFPKLIAGDFRDDVCVACLGIFLFCFVMGSNFDYRLIYLLAVMPPLLIHYDRAREATALIPLFLIVCLVWLSPFSLRLYFLDELFDWLLFIGVSAWLTDTMLNRIRIS